MQLQRSFSSCQERSLVGFLGPARAFSDSVSLPECVYFEKKFSKSFCKNRHDGREQLDLVLCSCDGSQVTEACPAPASAGEMI